MNTTTPQNIRWGFSIVAYVGMIAGMSANAEFRHITEHIERNWDSLMLPVIVSPLIFTACLSIIKSEIDTMTGVLIAFQNGFFWKQIFDGLAPITKLGGQ